jgi:hypothetical protein
MVGRLDAVDLDTDLVLLVLDRQALTPDELEHVLEAVDTDPFVFDSVDSTPDELGGYMSFFDRIGYLEITDDRERITLDAAGEVMVAELDRMLDDDQEAAIDDALETINGGEPA